MTPININMTRLVKGLAYWSLEITGASILLYNYHRNSQIILATLHREVAKTSRASIENVEAMVGGVSATLRLLCGSLTVD